MELYKKYRPKTLDTVVGNEDTVATLRNMLKRGTLPHTLLFHGPSGCGKTTLARILRKLLGCGALDFVEMNSSSFRGIDTIREVARLINLAPVNGPCRILLFDEVHKWTNDAQNAALKILEDTPPHVYFFLCTTDPQKLLKPIITRCTEMSVLALSEEELATLVKTVAKKEGVTLSRATVESIAESAMGSARSALVLLDKVCNLEEDQREAAISRIVAEQSESIELCRALIAKAPWAKVSKILMRLKGEVESTRYAVLGYANVVLKKSGNHQAYNVIVAFSQNFYDSKEAGLTAACYEAIHGDA